MQGNSLYHLTRLPKGQHRNSVPSPRSGDGHRHSPVTYCMALGQGVALRPLFCPRPAQAHMLPLVLRALQLPGVCTSSSVLSLPWLCRSVALWGVPQFEFGMVFKQPHNFSSKQRHLGVKGSQFITAQQVWRGQWWPGGSVTLLKALSSFSLLLRYNGHATLY